jgi:hypothetical protein
MKTAIKQEANINYYLNSKKSSVIERYADLKIVTYTTEVRNELKWCVMIWDGRKQNPSFNFYFNCIQKREDFIDEKKLNADKHQEWKDKRAAERKAFKPDVKVGDIYYSSWGYEQTNIDFYQVVKVSGKSTVELRQISQETVKDSEYSHGMACEVVAVKDSFLSEETITKRVGQYGINLNSYASASKWDGTPKYKSWYY